MSRTCANVGQEEEEEAEEKKRKKKREGCDGQNENRRVDRTQERCAVLTV
jgi:hypothetical protein